MGFILLVAILLTHNHWALPVVRIFLFTCEHIYRGAPETRKRVSAAS